MNACKGFYFGSEYLSLDWNKRREKADVRKVSTSDKEYFEDWMDLFKDDEIEKMHMEHLWSELNKSMLGENPTTFNALTICDSEGNPMTHRQAYENVNFTGAVGTLTISCRPPRFTKIDGWFCQIAIDLQSVQIEVNGKKQGASRSLSLGSSLDAFGGSSNTPNDPNASNAFNASNSLNGDRKHKMDDDEENKTKRVRTIEEE